ncbi:MAG: protein-L-isoaspartate O-methyltransferase [Alphaproteobacteria bacterium]
MAMSDFTARRLNMLESQLRTNQVSEPELLAVLGEVPRELFVPERLRGVAYVDEDIPLGGGRYMMAPLVLARLVQLAQVAGTENALDVGCGAGYSTAVLAKLCHSVVGLECAPELAAGARRRLRDLGVRNAAVVEGPLAAGHAPRAPYDAILLGGAVETIPAALADQLAEGGRLVAVVRTEGAVGRMTLYVKRAGLVTSRPVYDAATPPLPGFARPKEFVF